MRKHRILYGVVGCYALSYTCVLAIAARKGTDLASAYSLIVWLVSAAIIFGACAILPVIAFAILKFRLVWLERLIVLWAGLIVFLSLALFLTAA